MLFTQIATTMLPVQVALEGKRVCVCVCVCVRMAPRLGPFIPEALSTLNKVGKRVSVTELEESGPCDKNDNNLYADSCSVVHSCSLPHSWFAVLKELCLAHSCAVTLDSPLALINFTPSVNLPNCFVSWQRQEMVLGVGG